MRAIAILLLILMLSGCGADHASRMQAARFPESVTLYREEAGEIITLSPQEYLTGCLFAAISPSADEEALKATACIIAGNALYSHEKGERHLGADLTDSTTPFLTLTQIEELHASSADYYLEKVAAAVEFGLTHRLTYDNEPIYAPYCAYSTGRTEDGGAPWLPATDIPADKDNEQARSVNAFSAEQVRKLTGTIPSSADCAEWFSGAEYTEGGTLSHIICNGKRFSGAQLRELFGLRSTAVTIEYSEARFVFTARGVGDNLGMSLNAACSMAEQEMSAEEILAHFYPQTILSEF